MTTFKKILFIGLTIILLSFDLPTGWYKAGSHPKSYEMGIDKGSGQYGKHVATIKSIDVELLGTEDCFGTLMQTFIPSKELLGKTLKMTGFLKSQDLTDWAGFWLRVDQSNSGTPLAFDNMEDRPIKKTTEWTMYEIILQVPTNTSKIAFGALLSGRGQIWFDNLKFEIVDNLIPVTNNKNWTFNDPTNLDFEK